MGLGPRTSYFIFYASIFADVTEILVAEILQKIELYSSFMISFVLIRHINGLREVRFHICNFHNHTILVYAYN